MHEMILTEASVTGQRTVREGGKKEESGGGGYRHATKASPNE